MKILIVTPYFYPSWYFGGPPRMMHQFAKHLVQAGHHVTVYTTDSLDARNRVKKKTDEVDGIKIIYFRNCSHRFSTRMLHFNPCGFRTTIQREIQNFDVVHVSEFRTLMSYYTIREAHRQKIPSFLHFRGALPIAMQKIFLKKIFDWIYGNWMLQHATKVVALHEQEMQLALNRGIPASRIVVGSNAVDPRLFENFPMREIKRSAWNISKDEFLILYLGRLHKDKGIDLLLAALFQLPEKQFQLVLAGPDFGFEQPLRTMMKALQLPHQIRFLGQIEGKEKLEVLAAADVVTLPSLSEGLPGSILEAMACGIPVVISKFCNLPQVELSGAGFEVDLEPKKIAQTFEKLRDGGRQLYKTMGARGQKLVQEKYTWPALIHQYETLYKVLVESKCEK